MQRKRNISLARTEIYNVCVRSHCEHDPIYCMRVECLDQQLNLVASRDIVRHRISIRRSTSKIDNSGVYTKTKETECEGVVMPVNAF